MAVKKPVVKKATKATTRKAPVSSRLEYIVVDEDFDIVDDGLFSIEDAIKVASTLAIERLDRNDFDGYSQVRSEYTILKVVAKVNAEMPKPQPAAAQVERFE